MFKNIYEGKRVLVTGHTGFKGSWLSIWLKELGAEVAGYALEPPSEPNNFNACGLNGHITHFHGDIRDFSYMMTIFDSYQPEFVFHLAAQAFVRPSYEQPKLTFDTNAGGTVNIMEAVRLTPGVRVLVNITSDKCYENREWVWGYRENDAMGGRDPYSASKGCAELIFASYWRSFFNASAQGESPIGAASARAGNAIGGGDWGKDRLIPDCIRALNAGDPIGVRNPGAVRPWQHVLELLSGYLWLGACLWEKPDIYSGSWNFGPIDGDHLTVQEIVTRLVGAWGKGSWEDLSAPDTLHEAATLRLCCDKARTGLQWYNALTMDECITMTTDWYRAYYTGGRREIMYPLCRDQIWRYTGCAAKRGLPWAT